MIFTLIILKYDGFALKYDDFIHAYDDFILNKWRISIGRRGNRIDAQPSVCARWGNGNGALDGENNTIGPRLKIHFIVPSNLTNREISSLVLKMCVSDRVVAMVRLFDWFSIDFRLFWDWFWFCFDSQMSATMIWAHKTETTLRFYTSMVR